MSISQGNYYFDMRQKVQTKVQQRIPSQKQQMITILKTSFTKISRKTSVVESALR